MLYFYENQEAVAYWACSGHFLLPIYEYWVLHNRFRVVAGYPSGAGLSLEVPAVPN